MPAHCGKGEKQRAQVFSCGQSEYIAHASIIPYNKHNNNNIWIASIQLVYVGLAQARPNYNYICMVRPSPARAAIHITLLCAIYFDWPHENIYATPLPRAFSHNAQARVSSCTDRRLQQMRELTGDKRAAESSEERKASGTL